MLPATRTIQLRKAAMENFGGASSLARRMPFHGQHNLPSSCWQASSGYGRPKVRGFGALPAETAIHILPSNLPPPPPHRTELIRTYASVAPG